MKYNKIICLIFFLVAGNMLKAQRSIQSINSHWQFHKGNVQTLKALATINDWQVVNLPHTWNAEDAIDDQPGYYRGTGIYLTSLYFPAQEKTGKIYLYFEGVNQDAEVYVNYSRAGEHHGGYTAFCIDITPYLLWEANNSITVKVSNAEDPDWLPLSGDLCHFGGIYRDVYLIKTSPVHFDMNNHGSTGIFITPQGIQENKPYVIINGAIENDNNSPLSVIIRHRITSAEGTLITEEQQKLNLKPLSKTSFKLSSKILRNIQLWSPDEPNLYFVTSLLYDEKNQLLDEIRNPLGFRYFSIHKDKGFSLNGKHCFIKGMGRSQDYDHMGYAIPDEIQINDVRMMKEMGVNFLRSHYPQDPVVWNECDKLGIMMTGRIPLFDKIAYTRAFAENTKQMMREMILQNYNHPCVIMWEYMNEIFGGMDWYWPKPQDPEKMKKEKEEVYKLAVELEKMTRSLDPYRLTEQVFHTDPNPQWYKEAGLTSVSMINGWNIYFGWYHGNLQLVGKAIDEFHSYNPNLPYIISEYGAGSDNRIHTETPTVFDFSQEYMDMFHKVYLSEVAKRPWISGMCIWTWCDFQVDSRRDVMPHINNKGMVTADRKPKDVYYLYKARWNPSPMIYIAGKNWTERKAITQGEKTITKKVTVYSNLKEIELLINGTSLGKKKITDYEAVYEVPFREGQNLLLARDINSDLSDAALITYDFQPLMLDASCRELCINVGQSRTFFFDPLTRNQWLPDQTYRQGSWGHVNGNYYRVWNEMKAWQGIREGVDNNILNTSIDPVFQSFLVGVTEYRIDVPAGEYVVELYFTEPFSRERRLKPEEQTGADVNGDRIFNVLINQVPVLKNLNLAGQYGEQYAVIEKFETKTTTGGIVINLLPVKGEPVLSGIRIMKK